MHNAPGGHVPTPGRYISPYSDRWLSLISTQPSGGIVAGWQLSKVGPTGK